MIVLQKPIITEKSMKMASEGLYTFLVSKEANKLQITKAVIEAFKVTVLNVKTINVKGEIKQQRKVRKTFMTKGYKKALVQVKKGQIIPIFEAPKEEVTVTTAEGEPQVMKEKKDILRRTKVRVEKPQAIAQKSVMTGKGGDK
jgi:large subunit ribosomal protein L23